MSSKQILTVTAIVLLVIAVVGLILCRPMSSDSYAEGLFNFAAVSDIAVSAGEYAQGAADPIQMLLTDEDTEFDRLIDLFDVRGFGMTPAGLFSDSLPEPEEGDIRWRVTFHCQVSDSTLTAEYVGGALRLTGRGSVLVTTQGKESWAKDVFDLIMPLYPTQTDTDAAE